MVLLMLFALVGGEWVETTQVDFADGSYEVNLYSSHRGNGAVEFTPRWDANNDEWLDLVSCDVYGGSCIYWGAKSGFSDERRTYYLEGSGGVAFADLNTDGYTDYISTGPMCIHWGTPNGPGTADCTYLEESEEACFVADFDKDGYLDIAFDFANEDYGGIYWGSPSGYSETNVTLLPTVQAQHNIESADLNKDGWLNLVFVNQMGAYNTIYWGSESGFAPSNRKQLSYLTDYIHGCSVADLDADGWLDLVFTGNHDIEESWIYWGLDFSSTARTRLNTGECYGGSAVCDLNKDGLLDIVFFRGARDGSSYQTRIQWGDSDRFRSDSFSLVGPEFRASGGFVADFEQDGHLDIFVNSYDEASPIMYGPEFDSSEVTWLHGGIDHHAMAREIGNVYTREYSEEYYSSIHDADMDVGYVELSWDDSCPGQSRIRFAVRTGEKPDTSNDWPAWSPVNNGEPIIISDGFCSVHRYIQYKAIFEYTNPAELPILKEVQIKYEETEEIAEPLPITDKGIALDVIPTPTTSLCATYSLPHGESGTLTLYDATGRRIERMTIKGSGSIEFTSALPSGVYIVRLETLKRTVTRKAVILLK